ncbi:helix-turn-helix domain-containing protein [Micromonospora wenchangensis]|uniref:helix-turn-helix domain-containing protein n=1 Tax=Micromonospora wenchangensis TaxID=1185415 RepID=UPI0037F474A4
MTRSRSAEELFGVQVREAREQRGWTQEQLASYLRTASGIELSPTAMNRLELGKRPIRLNEVAALADLLGLGLRYGERDEPRGQGEFDRVRLQLEKLVMRADQLRHEEETLRVNLYTAESMATAARAAHAEVVHQLRRTEQEVAEITALLKRYDALTEQLSQRPINGNR